MDIVKKKQMENTLRKVCLASFGLLVASVLVQVFVSNKFAIKSWELVELQEEVVALEKETLELKKEITEFSRLSYVEFKALEQGFVSQESPFLTLEPVTVAVALTE